MHDITFKVKRRQPQPQHNDDESAASRERFLKGLAELEQIKSVATYQAALAAGVKISRNGFRKRAGIGSETMRNSDLYKLLLKRIDYINKKFASRAHDLPGRPPGTAQSLEIEKLKARIAELEGLLEARDDDIDAHLAKLHRQGTKGRV